MLGFLQINTGQAILHRCVLSVCDTNVALDMFSQSQQGYPFMKHNFSNLPQHRKLTSLNVNLENCICVDGRCAINAFYAEKLQYLPLLLAVLIMKMV